MKNINKWEKFLELNSGTYKNAAEKAFDYGNVKLMRDFEEYGNIIQDKEYDYFYMEILSISTEHNIYSFKPYQKHDSYDEKDIVDIKEYKKLFINGVVLVHNSYGLTLFNKTEDMSFTLDIEDSDADILHLRPLFWKLSSKKEAQTFIDELMKIHKLYIEHSRHLNETIKEIKLDVRDFYIRGLDKDYEKQEIDKKIEDYDV